MRRIPFHVERQAKIICLYLLSTAFCAKCLCKRRQPKRKPCIPKHYEVPFKLYYNHT